MHRYRTVWISDTHLGLKEARTDFLFDFLSITHCETLYLVGDIIDGWKMQSGGFRWPDINNDIVKLVLEKARKGTKVIYVPGNHDEMFRDYADAEVNNIQLLERATHTTADGRKLLVMHGDEFDYVVMHNRWIAKLGSNLYDFTLMLNRWFNLLRRKLGLRYWSLSAYLKGRVKEAVKYIGNFEQAVVREAREHGYDGIVCGHIHHATIAEYAGIEYINCGDWVESCTAIAEHENGRLELIRWVDMLHEVPLEERLCA